MPVEPSQPTFEAMLSRLEEIANLLERGDVSLEKALALYEEGIQLSQLAQRTLDRAELRIQRVNQSDGGDTQLSEMQVPDA